MWFHILVEHVSSCFVPNCQVVFLPPPHPQFTGCRLLRILISHIRYCKDPNCPACIHALRTHSVSSTPPHSHPDPIQPAPVALSPIPTEFAALVRLLLLLHSHPTLARAVVEAGLAQSGIPSHPRRPPRRGVSFHRSIHRSRAQLFLHEVDPSTEGCIDYYRVILDEMDLSKMSAKATRGEYKSLALFRQDFEDMMENCRVYNAVFLAVCCEG